MKKKDSLHGLLWVIGGIATVFLTMAALLPLLDHVLEVEVKKTENAVPTVTLTPVPAEEVLVTTVYVTEETGREITAIYIEVFHPGTEKISCVELPVDTKVTLSSELYKSLQAYSPELPQYLKLRKMAEGFSKEYAFTGCNRIVSEALGVVIPHYICADSAALAQWKELLQSEHTPSQFFEGYTEWLAATESDMPETARWIYYESFRKVKEYSEEMAAGTMEKDGFTISQKQVKKQLELFIREIEEGKGR